MTASSPSAPRGAWAGVVVFTVAGLALATSPWWAFSDDPATTRASVGLLLFGLAVLTVPWATYAVRIHQPRPRVRLVEQGIEVRLDDQLLVAVALLSTVWTAFLVWGVVAAGITGAGLLVIPFALVFAAILPDTLRALARRPRLTLSGDRLDVVGWSTDASIGWDDVASVDLAAPHVRRPVVRVAAKPGARSLTTERHRILVRLDLDPGEPAIDVPLLATPAPGRLITLLQAMAAGDASSRRARLDGTGVQFLDETLSPPGGQATPR